MEFTIINPTSRRELLSSLKAMRGKKFRLAAGCTDLLPELSSNPVKHLTVINLSHVKDAGLVQIKKTSKSILLGARVTAHALVVNEYIKKNFPVLHQSAFNLASTQIRHVATLGGNICTASPSGDMACALMALEAVCHIMNETGKIRKVPIRKFFTGVRKTVIKKNEFLYQVEIPCNEKSCRSLRSDWIKIGTRKAMECSVVSLASHIQLNAKNEIIKAGMAIGASAPVIRFTEKAAEFLIGKNPDTLSITDRAGLAKRIVEYASPISDIRASAWYRKEVLFNISRNLLGQEE